MFVYFFKPLTLEFQFICIKKKKEFPFWTFIYFGLLSAWNKNLLRPSTPKQNEYKQTTGPSWR